MTAVVTNDVLTKSLLFSDVHTYISTHYIMITAIGYIRHGKHLIYILIHQPLPLGNI